MTTVRRLLVLGGARSGKSGFAQGLAERSGLACLLIATGEALDDEMRERIERHKADRGAGWTTVEAPLALAQTIRETAAANRLVLVDCLTLWLSNVLAAERAWEDETAALADTVKDAKGPIVLVSNEVGHGIVPGTPLGRRFRDAQGRLNQAMAASCDGVVLVTAGCPSLIKPAPALDLMLA